MVEAMDTQRKFFSILDEFFRRLVGKSARDFSTPERFDESIKAIDIQRRSKQIDSALSFAFDSLRNFYTEVKMVPFQTAKELGGLKLVLGGGSRFTATHFNSVRRLLLYADTILIPDPVLPWIEVDRPEEKFRLINLLKNTFMLLHLKPLIDAELAVPAVLVFPSWEKSLEQHDEETEEGIRNLLVSLLSLKTGQVFDDFSHTLEFAREDEDNFLELVQREELFIPPGGTINMPLDEAIARYRADIKTWRSDDYADFYLGLTNGELVWNGIAERIAPQWHLIENSEELMSHPMLALESHWHYYKICTSLFEGRLFKTGLISPETESTLRALDSPRFGWLGNIPMDAIVTLRQHGENEDFRKRIGEFIDRLHDTAVIDVDRVAGEVARGIASLLTEHAQRAEEIREKYQRKYAQTLVASSITLGAQFVPALAPFFSIVPPLALVGKYAFEKWEEKAEVKRLSRSLMGVFSAEQK